MKRNRLLIVLGILLAAGALAWLGWQQFRPAPAPSAPVTDSSGVVQDNSGKTVRYWYDPMVPAQKFDKPGKSPFMDMQLVPKYADEEGRGSAVAISPQTQQNLGIRLAQAETMMFGEDVRAVGRIAPDERSIYTVQTRIPGFVERLLVRAVGDPVKKGQKIAEVYAPELLAAQQEYLALGKQAQLPDADSLQQAAHRRLELLGMSPREIAAISNSGTASPRFGIYAPASGVVTELGLREGAQLMAGNSLMQITNLNTVWLMAEVPERDIARITPGTQAEVRLQSLPGEAFRGRVAYIYPTLDETTRTVQVRVQLPNRNGLLRPGMYADVSFDAQQHETLAVPSESVIVTGTRKVVIVKDEHGFRPVEVVTGQQAGGNTEIIDGLHAGETVVASGQFLIDSEASLSGVLDRLAQQAPAEHGMTEMTEQAGHDMRMATPQKMPTGRGKVVAVDAAAGKVTLAHQPIPELGWPPMTMDFNVADGKQLAGIKIGDEVEFKLEADAATGQYRIEQISKQRENSAGAQ